MAAFVRKRRKVTLCAQHNKGQVEKESETARSILREAPVKNPKHRAKGPEVVDTLSLRLTSCFAATDCREEIDAHEKDELRTQTQNQG